MDKINHRFSLLNSSRSDNRVWSIQSFDSIVAFHINHQATNLLSKPTNNNGVNDATKDFRHSSNKLMNSISFMKFRFIKHIPGAQLLAEKVRTFISNRTDSNISVKIFFLTLTYML